MFLKTSVFDKFIFTRKSFFTGFRVFFGLLVIVDILVIISYIYYIFEKGREIYVVAIDKNYGFYVYYS